jgi:hypothetical protein
VGIHYASDRALVLHFLVELLQILTYDLGSTNHVMWVGELAVQITTSVCSFR